MTATSQKPEGFDTGPTVYRIHVAGLLDERWSRWFGMSLTSRKTSTGRVVSELYGPLQDQAALAGVLDRIFNYGAVLLRLERLESPTSVLNPAAPPITQDDLTTKE